MKTNKILLAGLAGGIASFLMGWLLWGIVFRSYFESNMGSATNLMKPEAEMVWWALIAGNLLSGLLLAIIFGRWASISTFVGGLKAGATIGLLMGLSYSLVSFATSNMYILNSAIVDSLLNAVVGGVAGGVVGWVLGMKKPA